MENKNYDQVVVTQSIVVNEEKPFIDQSKKFNNQSTFFKMENISMIQESEKEKKNPQNKSKDKKIQRIQSIYADSKYWNINKRKTQNRKKIFTSKETQSTEFFKHQPSHQPYKNFQLKIQNYGQKNHSHHQYHPHDLSFPYEQNQAENQIKENYEMDRGGEQKELSKLVYVNDSGAKIEEMREKGKSEEQVEELKLSRMDKKFKEICRKKEQSIKEKVKVEISEERKKQIQMARTLLSEKVSIVWIFVLGDKIKPEYEHRILKMYNGLSQKKYIAPLCKSGPQIKPFLSIKNSLFKIVSDLTNFEDSLRFKINKNIVEYYVYNEQGSQGVSQALQYKSESRKVKGIYTSLEKVLEKAEDEVQNELYLYQSKNGIERKKYHKFFPSFLKLTGQDKTDATNYRSNLLGAKNLPVEQKLQKYAYFMELVKQKYQSDDRQKKNIADYEKINHRIHIENEKQARKIIQFYVRESFYYKTLNTLLRTVKTTEEFKPCILPFNQTYHAIKCFYSSLKGKIEKQTLYRGAKIRKKDFETLKPNMYIEMFGFMSTSKSFQRAVEFTDRDGYIFVIEVPKKSIPEKYKIYDHGFIDINKNNLAYEKFSQEEEVLFNALNVFKVLSINEDEEGRTLIRLQYGVIFDLLQKKKGTLNEDERDVLLNYQYCMEMLQEIEDQGDVHLLANEFQESKGYYFDKLKGKQEDDGKYLFKLANVQQKCGQLEDANQNAKKSLSIQMKKMDLNDRQMCMKVYSVHSKNAQISLEQEDFLQADDALTEAIQLLGDENEFQKAKKIRERGQIKFKKGEIINAEKDFEQSESRFRQICQKGEERRRKIKQHYLWKVLTFFCQTQTLEEIRAHEQEELQEILEIEEEISNMTDKIDDQLIKVNNSLKDVAEYVEDKSKYEICVKKARSFLFQLQSRKTHDPLEKAKLKAMEATIQDYLDLVESEKLLNEAIELVQQIDPNDKQVGKYSEVLAKLQKETLQKFTNPKCLMKAKLEKGQEPITYNQKQHEEIYKRCRNNYQKAINVLLYNNKSHESAEIMNLKNQLGELDFNESNYESSEKIIKEVRDKGKKSESSEVSKSCLLLAKIALARGELKNSFFNVEEAQTFLRRAIVKKDNPQYFEIYHRNDTYLQILLHRSKIYLKQLKHDLSLKDIEEVRSSLQEKLRQQEFHSMLPETYQLEGENFGTSKQLYGFDKHFKKAILLRERQIGKYNLGNAVAYCNYAKYLIIYKDFEGSKKALSQAMQIFSCFSSDHPITWLVLYCYGILKASTNLNEQAITDFERCLMMAEKKYDKTHITLNKVRMQYAKQLHKVHQWAKAVDEYERLEDDLDENIRLSNQREKIEEEGDDEKITMKKLLYKGIKELEKERKKLDETENGLSQLRITNYENKIMELKKTFRIKE